MGGGGSMDGYSGCEIGIRNRHLDLTDAAAETAALMGAERNDLLSGEVVALQESENGHGRKAPPIGIAQDYGIVLIHILHFGRELGTGLGTKLFLGLVDADHIVRRVLFYGVYLENIGIGKLRLDLLYDNFVIALCKVAYASVNIILPAAGIECDKCLCHSCYQLTDAKIGVFAKCPVIDFSQEIIEIPEIETTGFPGKGQFCLPGLRIMKTTAPTQTAIPIPIFSVIGSPKRSVPIKIAVNGSKTPRMEVFVGPI